MKRLKSKEDREARREKQRCKARRRLQDVTYREAHKKKQRCTAKRRLEDAGYRRKHCATMRSAYRTNISYREATRQRSHQRYHSTCTSTNVKHKQSSTAKYWARRSRVIARAKESAQSAQLERTMQSTCGVPLLDVKLLLNKARHRLKRGKSLLTQMHTNLQQKATDCLEQLPSDQSPSEEQLLTAFDNSRSHTCTTESYFWDQCYRLYTLSDPIAVDSTGKAHIFKPVSASKKGQTEVDNATAPTSVSSWECDSRLCVLPTEAVDGVVALLRGIAAKNSSNCTQFYAHLDDCSNPARDSRLLGHSFYCCRDNGCRSLLRPIRTLSPHFPYLRTIVRLLYAARRCVAAMQSLTTAMHSGDYVQLKEAVKDFDSNMLKLSVSPATQATGDEGIKDNSQPVDEDSVMEKFGPALRRVTEMRDNYITSCCDVCEQLRKDVAPLQSYQGKRGYDSHCMREALDLLYQHKTKDEDVYKFMENIQICKYCASKLCENKEVARSFFNQLSVSATPQCITDLNLFERALIKFTMTCITVVRLGQITNKNRPRNELTAALKGRIAYLPVDVQSNAEFLPDNLLNLDSLVLLVGSQPTQQQRVWTSVVDLKKVHTALAWLRDNNPLYKDIPVYSLADIEAIIARQLDGQQHQTAPDNALLKRLNDAAQSHLYENFSVQPLSSDYPADVLVDYQLNKVNGQRTDFFDPVLDLKAFPELFPTGEHGLKDSKRFIQIGTSKYIKSRLLHRNSKFRLNINYLFHCFQIQEVSNMCHSIGHMLRTVTGKNMSAQAFMERLQQRDGEIQSKMFSMMANLRGSKEHFSKLGMDLKWAIKSLGPPTLFLTCSTAEWFSEPLLQHLKEVNKDVPNIDRMTPAELCCMDPVTVSIHFHQKWNAIFKSLIKDKNTPIFGEVADHFWRIEYQARGAPHVHCILWIKNAPVLGKNTIEEVQDYINSICTCSLPNSDTSPTLHNLVNRFQVHKCNSYCTKSYKRQGSFYKKCRFGFPRPTRPSIQINDVVECLAVSRNKQPRKRLYHLPRGANETYINDYNPALLIANQANVDIQFIGHAGSRLPYYVTSYITKHERSEQDAMWRDIFTTTKPLGSNALSFLLKSIKNRQVGANEAADRLLGHKLHSKSRQVHFADLSPPDKIKRLLKPAADISAILKSNPQSEDIFQPHWVLDVYTNRPDELESCSLHDLLAWYEKQRRTDKDKLVLKTMDYSLRRRQSKPYIVSHQVVNPNQSDEQKERYFYYLLKLHKPWRSETDLLLPQKNYFETYLAEEDNLPDMKAYHESSVHMARKDEEMEKEINEVAQKLRREKEEGVAAEDEESVLAGCRTDQLRTAMQDVIDTHARSVQRDADNNNNLKTEYEQLNSEQQRVVDKVINAVCCKHEQLLLTVSGQGGTGKSRIIDILNRTVSQKMKEVAVPVVVAAPTGLAAFNIGGTTIHRLLSLPIEHGKPADYSRLQLEQLTLLRATLKNIRLLIIDEVSMVSSLTLLQIHMRLIEILGNNEIFGGVSVVFFADLLQLPPVKGNQVYIPVTFDEAKQRFGAIGSVDLWQYFQYEELTINMRQNGDAVYARLLSDVRLGQLSDEQHVILQERMIMAGKRAGVTDICDRYNQLVQQGECPLILLPRTSLCDEINTEMLRRIGNHVYSLEAIDTLDTVIHSQAMMRKVQAAYEKSDDDVTRTAGLEKHLQLCIGCKVMLKRNMNVDAGLVNGAVGTVRGFSMAADGSISSVAVEFDGLGIINIQRESATFEVLKSIFYTRKQFALMLAFAITIHKSQGLSLCSAIVDAGATNFGPGMVYVALSRVTSLAGLHLIDLDKTKIACDRKAVEEYNRLRGLYMPELGELRAGSGASHSAKNDRQARTKRAAGKRKSKSIDNTSGMKKRRPSNEITQTAGLTHSADTKGDRVKLIHPHFFDSSNVASFGAELPQQISVFNYCNIYSLDDTHQKSLCTQLNLRHFSDDSTMPTLLLEPAEQLSSYIYKQTGQHTSVKVYRIEGLDQNCLFRALSMAITQSQSQHDLVCAYVVNHTLDNSIRDGLQNIYARNNDEFHQNLINMQQPGEWGTDCQIAAAAHLLDLSILCFCHYSNHEQARYKIQHFPPHFAITPDCSSNCQHKTLYLMNTSGIHYDLATVSELPNVEE